MCELTAKKDQSLHYPVEISGSWYHLDGTGAGTGY